MTTTNYLAVDLGAESGRTVVGSFDGKRFDLQETHRFSNGAVRVFDTFHWNALGLWQEIKTGIAKSVQISGAPASLGVDTWGVDFGLIRSDGSLAGNPVQYRDPRTEGILEVAYSIVPKAKIYERTGLQFMRFNSLFQLLAMARRGKDPFTGVAKMLFMPDLFNYFLTGRQTAEYSIASTSQMLDARTRQWAMELLEAFELPTHILPELVDTGTRLGGLLPSVAADTGAAGTQVIATAGHDTASAVAAVPAKGENWLYISSGTWSLMGAELPGPAITPQTLADNFTNEGGVSQRIRFLKNIMGLWLVQQCRRSFERAGRKYDYGTLAGLAEDAPAFGAVIDPDHDSFLNPDDMPAAIRQFCIKTGQQPPDNDGAIVRCCLEGLALRYRRTLDQIQASTGRKFDTIHIVGGGSQNWLLCQFTADCCGVTVITGPVEATALGNCMVQAISSGEIRDLEQGREVVCNSFPTQRYEPHPATQWNEAYELFRKVAE